jgi:hypothetical protein
MSCNIPNIINLPIVLNTIMISSNLKSNRKIATQIGGVYIHPNHVVSDFNFDEFINDFNAMINKLINTSLRIHIELDEDYNNLEITVHTTKMINWDYITKMEKCVNILLKFRGKYKKPPTYSFIESYTPAA